VFPKLSGQKSPKHSWHLELVRFNFAQFWEHTDVALKQRAETRGQVQLWSFNNPNPVFERLGEANIRLYRPQNGIKTRNTAKKGHKTPPPPRGNIKNIQLPKLQPELRFQYQLGYHRTFITLFGYHGCY
jgi:hypothetical protein